MTPKGSPFERTLVCDGRTFSITLWATARPESHTIDCQNTWTDSEGHRELYSDVESITLTNRPDLTIASELAGAIEALLSLELARP